MTNFHDLEAARTRIAPHIHPTPAVFDDNLGAQGAWIKWENQQVTGSFKARGAFNKILSLTEEERSRGLIACSAGNHGQGVALAAQLTGAHVTVYVPHTAARLKIEKMRALGAEVIEYPGDYGQTEAAAIRIAKEQGKAWVSPYNDPLIIAGQGTVALEILEQCPDATQWLVPVGGGGLIAGIMAGAGDRAVIAVQSEASPFLHHEYHYRDMSNALDLPSLADGLSGSVEPGSITIELIHTVNDFLLVNEIEIAKAITYAYHKHSQVIEGSGAVGLAAIMSGKVKGDFRTMVLVSGGNIDAEKHRRIIFETPL